MTRIIGSYSEDCFFEFHRATVPSLQEIFLIPSKSISNVTTNSEQDINYHL